MKEVEGKHAPKPLALDLKIERKEPEEAGEADFACLIRAPWFLLNIFNYGGVIRPEHSAFH